MPIGRRIASLLRNLFARTRVERELDDELRAWLEQVTGENLARGMSAEEARRAARIELGGIEQVKEEVRQVRSGRVLREFLRDVRYGWRALGRNPSFAAVAILALALGIGANTAMFSVAYGMLWRSLPYAAADRVAVVFMRYYPRDFAWGTLSVRDYLLWRENNHAFETPALFRNHVLDIAGAARLPEQVQGAEVTAGFFSTLGVRPLIGRTFAEGDDRPNAPTLVVVSESLWRRRFNSSPGVLGQTILVNGLTATVVGVAPGNFRFPLRDTEIWATLPLNPPARFGPWFYRAVARLKPGATLARAQGDLAGVAQRLMQQNPTYKRLALPVLPLRDALLGPSLKPAILVLAGAVGLVLLIAVVNVANLMLARATVRQREMALRLSLGAGRGRLARQLLAESVVLAVMGGAAGLALAWAGIALIRAWNPGNFPLIDSIRLDWRVLAFLLGISVLTGILFGLAPALESGRAELNSALKEGGRGAAGGRSRGRMRSALVVSEVALALMLLVGAGLLLRSFANLTRVNGGFSAPPQQVVHMFISPGSRQYNEPAAGLAFYDEALRRVRALPGVEWAAITDTMPPDRQGDADTFMLEGQTLPPGETNPIVSDATVTPDYFRALGIPLVAGRYFNEHDTAGARAVAIVSEGFARRFLRGNALGKRIQQSGPGAGGPWMEIVGIVGNVKYLGLAVDTDPAYYMPFAQSYEPRMFLVARTSGDAAPVVDAVRRDIQSIDRGVALAWTGTLRELLDTSVSQPRFDSLLLALFSAIALLLAAVGVYGLIGYSVAQRTHEIGVRMALGAARSDVLRMVVRQGAVLAALGIALGLGGALALTRLLKTMLFGVGITDTATFLIAPAALLLVVLAAALVPALRATRISPVLALRYE